MPPFGRRFFWNYAIININSSSALFQEIALIIPKDVQLLEFISKGNSLKLNIQNEAQRSNAVTTVFSKGFDFTKTREWISKQGGVELGVGLGFTSSELLGGKSVFRIGHMGHLNPHMILGVLSILEAGLSFNKIPHQSGGVTVANNYMLKMIKKINKSTSL